MSGHTPGPLETGPDPLGGDYMVCVMVPGKAGQYGTEVARCDHNWNDATAGDRRISWKEAECNARLFAAAPELLDVVKALTAYEGHMAWCGHGNDMSKPCVCGLNIVHEQALAAIAKATGAA